MSESDRPPAQPSEVEKARLEFEEWVTATIQYEPAHLCALGEDDPQDESCIPCNTLKSARRLIVAERADAVKGMHAQSCGCHTLTGTEIHKRMEWVHEGHDHPYIDSYCLAAREKVRDGR